MTYLGGVGERGLLGQLCLLSQGNRVVGVDAKVRVGTCLFSSEGVVEKTQERPEPAIIHKAQIAAASLPYIVGVVGFIYLIFDIVQAFQGHAPAWWIWIGGIIVWLGGFIIGASIMEIPQEQFLRSLVVIVYALCVIFGFGGLIDLIIDIVLAAHGHSPAWWIWTITISVMILGVILTLLPDEMQKWKKN